MAQGGLEHSLGYQGTGAAKRRGRYNSRREYEGTDSARLWGRYNTTGSHEGIGAARRRWRYNSCGGNKGTGALDTGGGKTLAEATRLQALVGAATD